MRRFYKPASSGEGYKSHSVLYCYGAFTPSFSSCFCLYGPVYDSVIDHDRSGETKLLSSHEDLQRYHRWKLLPKLFT